jgi:formylglycine-generating enzyme required for sulfatase activity
MDVLPTTQELTRARAHTDALFDIVSEQTLYDRPIPERHRLIFYIGHLDAFDWNQIARGIFDEPSFQPSFDRLFEAGIDPPPGQAPSDSPADWPALHEVRGYALRARARLDALWEATPEERRRVALEHRWMHAETLCYLLHQFPHESKRPPMRSLQHEASHPAQRDPDFVTGPAGTATLGQQTGAFGWDNEFPAVAIGVPEFRISRRKVTNADYLGFVANGGPVPPFWSWRSGRWWLRRMFDDVPLTPDLPVYVTHAQARAYAQWSGGTLPTEAQWQRAAYGDDGRPFPWGTQPPAERHGNFEFLEWDPVGVAAHPASASPFGAEQMVGNGWEWTASPFAGFPGFQPRAYYPGYSANFFDGEHWVLKGGSPRTARCLLRRSFRNWFRGDYPFAYTTFRTVQD